MKVLGIHVPISVGQGNVHAIWEAGLGAEASSQRTSSYLAVYR